MRITERELKNFINMGGKIELKFIETENPENKFLCYARVSGENVEKTLYTMGENPHPRQLLINGVYSLSKKLGIKKCTVIFV